MNRTWFVLSALLLLAAPCRAEDADPLAGAHKSLKDSIFVVETSPDDESESLNRISGDIDLGFTLPEQSYESEGHYRPGPFGREALKDKAQSAQSY